MNGNRAAIYFTVLTIVFALYSLYQTRQNEGDGIVLPVQSGAQK